MVQTATALMAVGRNETALRALVYLICAQQPDGSFSQNFWVNGTPYWSSMQLDEVAFPIILAWRLWKQNALDIVNVFPFVERAAGYLMKFAPVTQQERWEENAGYSPSTLAAVITGLICASELMCAHDAPDLANFYAVFADWIESNLEAWTVTDDGVLLPEVRRHYMRIRPPATVTASTTPLWETEDSNWRIEGREKNRISMHGKLLIRVFWNWSAMVFALHRIR